MLPAGMRVTLHDATPRRADVPLGGAGQHNRNFGRSSNGHVPAMSLQDGGRFAEALGDA